jgi:hypothetical protein
MLSREESTSAGFKDSFGYLRSEGIKLRQREASHIEEVNGQINLLNKNIDQLRAQLGPQCTFGMVDDAKCQLMLPYPCECDKTGCQTCFAISEKGVTSRLKIVCHKVDDFKQLSNEEKKALQTQWQEDFKTKTCGDDGVDCGPPGHCHLKAPKVCTIDGEEHVCIPGFEDVEAFRDTANMLSEDGKGQLQELETVTGVVAAINNVKTYQEQQDLYEKIKDKSYDSSLAKCFIKVVKAKKDQDCQYKYISDPSIDMGGGDG